MYLFKILTELDKKKQLEDSETLAKIDYRNISSIVTVIKDEVIGEAFSPDVLTEEEKENSIKINDLNELASFIGSGVYIKKGEPSRIYAEKSGELIFSDGKFYVNDTLKIENIDFKTGNIVFPGDVIVEGDIKAGFSINARNIHIKGAVDNAELIAGETVIVHGGVIGLQSSDFCKVKAGRIVILNFIENSSIECDGAVYIRQSSMHTDIYAKERIAIYGNPGLAVGGELISRKNIAVKEAGAKWGTKTILKVGIDPFKYLRLKNSEEKISQLTNLMEEVDKSINYINSVLADNNQEAHRDKEELEQELKEIEEKKAALSRRINRLRSIVSKLKTSIEEENKKLNLDDTSVYIFNKIFPGVEFRVGIEHHRVYDETEGAQISLENDKIVFKKI